MPSKMVHQLCKECVEFFGKSLENFCLKQPLFNPEFSYQGDYPGTVASMEIATSQGCPICTLLLRQLEMDMWEAKEKNKIESCNISEIRLDGSIYNVSESTFYPDHGPMINYISITLFYPPLGHGDSPAPRPSEFSHVCVELHRNAFSPPALAIPIEPSTGSAQAFNLMQQWLKRCISNHPTCSSPIPNSLVSSSYPTRLLFVAEGQLKLVETTNLVKVPAYFTLSHCWGTIEILKLTKENAHEFRQSIPEDQFCKTFKDAVYITRMLGYQYLWIDSLCIIQNDVQDWRNEASKMSGVYGGSTLNLAASAASDGSMGCFCERSDAELQRTKHYQVQINLTDSPQIFNCIDPTLYESCIQQCPLNRRGWTFQERFLSPRTLHFTKLQLYWECRENIACEMYQDALPHFVQNGNFGFIERNATKGAWLRAVCHYSPRLLTYKQDKLPAIAGVARNIQSQTGDEYVAGLWKSNLESELLWRTYDRGLNTPFAGDLPSWS